MINSKLIIRGDKKYLRFHPPGYDFYLELPVITHGSREKKMHGHGMVQLTSQH